MRTVLLGTALAVAASTSASAQNIPWEQPAPEMTASQSRAAAAVNDVVSTAANPLRRLGLNPLTTEWDWQGGRRAEEPMSNMTFSGLRELLSGKYRVYQAGGAGSDGSINIGYHHQDGTVYRCLKGEEGWDEDVAQWFAGQSAMGFAGILKLSIPASEREGKRTSTYGWPTVYDPGSGQLVGYGFYETEDGDRSWQANAGHVQRGYAPVFEEICPNLPKTRDVNPGQTAKDYKTFLSQAPGAPVKGNRGTVFTVNPEDPLTAEMYYATYPPEQ
jgi:hypothetical protein